MLAILYAMDEEVQGVHDLLKDRCTLPHAWAAIERGYLDGREIALVKCGAGKVLSSITAQSVIDTLSPHAVALCGVSGALNRTYQRGDLVIGTEFIQHDVSAEFLGFERGQIPFTDIKVIPASPNLLAHTRTLLEVSDSSIHEGRVISGDQFVSGDEGRKLREAFSADVVDMESAAVAFTCHVNQVPFVVARTISDKADESAENDFSEFLPMASRHITVLVRHLVGVFASSAS
jgi:adenosylhomocysteine nucleosidase